MNEKNENFKMPTKVTLVNLTYIICCTETETELLPSLGNGGVAILPLTISC